MTQQEVIDYSGMIKRDPTPEEIDLIAAYTSVVELRARQESGIVIPLKQIPEILDKIIQEEKVEISSTGCVFDFVLNQKRLLFYSKLRVSLHTHDDIHNHISTIGSTFLIDNEDRIYFSGHSVNDICLLNKIKNKS